MPAGDVGGGVWNIACCCHLAWRSSTTTCCPAASRCRHENMRDRTSQELHSKSKVIQYFFFVHYCKNIGRLKGKTEEGKHFHHTWRSLVSTAGFCLFCFFQWCVKHWAVVRKRKCFGPCSHKTTGEGVRGSCVRWSCTAGLEEATAHTVQPSIDGRLCQEQGFFFSWLDQNIEE